MFYIQVLTKQKPEKAQRKLKKFNVKHIYFVNNSPDTIGARSLTIPRYGIPKKPTKVWFFTISFKLQNRNYISWCKGYTVYWGDKVRDRPKVSAETIGISVSFRAEIFFTETETFFFQKIFFFNFSFNFSIYFCFLGYKNLKLNKNL